MLFKWKSLSVWVGEMSQADALALSRELEEIKLIPDKDMLAREINFLFTRYAPCRVTQDDKLLSDGEHELTVEQGLTLKLDIPLTRGCFYALPLSLSAAWTKAAEDENEYAANFFLTSLTALAHDMLEPTSSNAP